MHDGYGVINNKIRDKADTVIKNNYWRKSDEKILFSMEASILTIFIINNSMWCDRPKLF